MPVLEPVVATLTANTEEFTAALDDAKAQMAEFEATVDSSSAEGDLAGIGVAGKDAGIDVADGATLATAGLEDTKVAADDAKDGMSDIANSAGLAGAGLRDTHDAAEDAESGLRDTESAAEDAGKAAEDSGGKFGILANLFGNMPGPIGEASSKTKEFKGSIEEAGESSSGFGSILGDIPVPAVIAGAAIAGVAAVSVDLASKYQTVTNQIAASEGITTGAATNIGKAFLTTAGQTTMSAQQIATAFAGVAGQAKQINGSALSAGQSLGLMKSAIDLAEASGTSLTSATSALTTSLQAFGLGIKSSPLVSDVLYSAANATGQNVTALGNALDKVKTKLGGMAPPIQQLGGLLVDLASHGETGRASMQALTTTFTNFLKPATDLATAQNDLKAALSQLPPSLQALGQQVANGTITSTAYTAATEGLSATQAELIGNVKTAQAAFVTASDAQAKMGITAVTSKGQLESMSSIIGQLQEKIKGQNTAQATATLSALGFGNASAKLVATIQAGPAAYDKYVAEVEKTNAAHAAAEKATSGMDASFEKAKSAIEDAGVALGEKLMPYVTEAAQGIAEFAAMIVKDWPQISAAFKVAFDIIGPILKGMIDQIKGTVEVIAGLVEFVKDIFTGQWGAAWDAIKRIFDGFVEVFKGEMLQLFGALLGPIESGLSAIGGFFSSAWRSIESTTISIWNGIVSFFTGIPGDLLGALSALGGDIMGWISDVWGTFKAWIESAWVAEIAFWTALPGKFVAALAALGGLLQGWISSAFNAFKGFIEGAWNNEVAFWSAIPGRIISALASLGGDLLSLGSAVMGALSNGIVAGWGAVESFFTGLWNKITTAIGDLYDDALGIGKRLMDGLAQGIENGLGEVGNAIKDVYNDTVGKLTSFFGISSPSKVFQGYGVNLMEGLAAGITAGSRLPASALQSVNTQLSLGAGGISGGVGPSTIAPITSSTGGGAAGGISAQVVNQPINLVVSGQTLAQIVTQFQLRGARSTGNIAGQYSGSTQTAAATSINTNAVGR